MGMTWIAACSGQRGTYQETIMADEDLREAIRQGSHDVDYVKSMLETAADLLERLAQELVATNKRLEQLEARLEALERM
jgi:hypothetical protein